MSDQVQGTQRRERMPFLNDLAFEWFVIEGVNHRSIINDVERIGERWMREGPVLRALAMETLGFRDSC